jgi:thymidylate synthase (FAD)
MTAETTPPRPPESAPAGATTAGAGAAGGAGAAAGVAGTAGGAGAIRPRMPRNPGRHELGMKATLLFPDREIVERYYVPLIYTACRTCYSELEPDEIFRRAVAGEIATEKQQKLIAGVIESGHGSTIEHIVFTFGISGVSRTLSHQLVRHRAGVAFDQQSQRYVKYKGASTMMPASIAEADPALRERYEQQVAGALELYGELVEAGIPGEDARFVFPNATRTNLVMTTNLRALIHMSGLRLCTMAQWEIRRLFQLIRHEVFTVSPFLGSFLAPKCVPLGYCDEMNNRDGHCPIRPHKDVVLAAWSEKARASRPGAPRPASGPEPAGR